MLRVFFLALTTLLLGVITHAQQLGQPLPKAAGLCALRKNGLGQINLRVCTDPNTSEAFFCLYFLDDWGNLCLPAFNKATLSVIVANQTNNPSTYILEQSNHQSWLQAHTPIPTPYNDLKIAITLTEPILNNVEPTALPLYENNALTERPRNQPYNRGVNTHHLTLSKEYYDYAPLLQ